MQSGWKEMLDAEADRLWPITRAVDLRETLGHPPEGDVLIKAARYCIAPVLDDSTGAMQVLTGGHSGEAAVPCSMWSAATDGPWYMQHAKQEAISPWDSAQMLRAVTEYEKAVNGQVDLAAVKEESSKEETSAVAKYTDKFMQLQKVCHFAMPCHMTCDMSCHMTCDMSCHMTWHFRSALCC